MLIEPKLVQIFNGSAVVQWGMTNIVTDGPILRC